MRTLCRRVRLAEAEADRPWQPGPRQWVVGIVARLTELSCWAAVLAGDETLLNLLPHVRVQLDAARQPPAHHDTGHEPAGHCVRRHRRDREPVRRPGSGVV